MSTLFRRILSAVLACALLATASPAFSKDRAEFYFGESPQSSDLNFIEQSNLIALGEWMWDSVGRSASPFYVGLSVTSPTGLYVQVGPTIANTNGAVFVPGAADTSPVGAGGPFTGLAGYAPLAANATQILHEGLITVNTAAIGPLVAPSGSNSVIDLVECRNSNVDSSTNNVNFVSPANLKSQSPVAQRRYDTLFCQAKLGTASTTPVAPTLDSGYASIATVTLPASVSTILPGYITATTPWGGFQLAGSGQNFVDTTTNGQTIASTKIFTSLQTVTGTAIKFTGSGLGSMSGPSIAADGQANLGLYVNTATGSNGVQFLTNGTSNGASVSALGAFISGGSYYGSTAESINGSVQNASSITAAIGNSYGINSNASTPGGYVGINYGNGATNNAGGLRVYDGGTSTFGSFTPTALTVGGSTYGATSATVAGPIASTSLAIGHCVTVNASYQLIDAGGACGLSSGTLSSITSANALLNASNTAGAVTLTPNETPTFTGASVTSGPGTAGGQFNFGTDGTVNLARSGSNIVATTPGQITSLNGFSSGSSLYYPTQTNTNGNNTTTGSISAGSATQATLVAGDLGASRGVSTGAIQIGGSTSHATIDYGVTYPSTLTLGGYIVNIPGGSGLSVPNGGIQTSSVTSSSYDNSNSVSTNALYLGGPMYQSGSTVGPWNATAVPAYATNGTALGAQHMVEGSVAMINGTTVTVNFSGAAVFTAYNTFACFPTQAGGTAVLNPPTFQTLSGSSFQVYESSGYNYSTMFICIGA